jgi:hypothetical protein
MQNKKLYFLIILFSYFNLFKNECYGVNSKAYSIESKFNVNTTFTLRSQIDSNSTSEMTVYDSSGYKIVNTINVSKLSTDSSWLWIDSGINWTSSSNTFNIPPDVKYWLIPFDGSNPIQIADLGGGGGGGGASRCYKQFCPCQPGNICENKCFPSQGGVDAQGRTYSVCRKTYGDQNEPCKETGCDIKICRISCSGGVVISNTFNGPAFIMQADYLIYNGVLY